MPINTPSPSASGKLPFMFLRVSSLVCSGILLCTATSRAAAPAREAKDIWADVAAGRLPEAHAAFTAPGSGIPERERVYGEAVSFLNLQPRSASHIEKSAALLDSIIAGPEDSMTVPARYLRARIDQLHLTPADVPSALKRYDELFASHPDHPLAQVGATTAAMVRIYSEKDDPLGKPYAEAEEIATRLTDPTVRAGMHLMLANAAIRLGKKDRVRALGHYEKAHEAGIRSPRARSTVLACIGGLSEELGRPARAIAAYEEFLANFERDDRAHTIRERLAALKEGAR